VLLVAASAIILLGIITAEAVYPDVYTTHENEISDLGATRPPDSITRQPSARIFNSVMMASGVALIGSALMLMRGGNPRRVWISVGLLGIGVLGVGVFPGNRDPYHGLFAMLAFVAGGFAAVLSTKVQEAPFRYVSLLLGLTTLGALVVAFLGDTTPIWGELGDGGVERWVAYPVVLWMAAFGGYLMAPVNTGVEMATPD
jgi:hypothetical membrane protein